MAADALRVLGIAIKPLEEVPTNPTVDELENDLTFIGLVGLIDPPREEAKAAIKQCKNAGITTVMITGDHKDTAVAMIRPQRYTMQFVEKNDYYALSFYGDNKDIHKVCGSKSGKDVNKTELTGLTPVFADNTVYFEEAKLVIICKKQYVGRLEEECFIDKEPLKWYADKDYHNMIIGKIEKVLVKE